MRSVAQYFSEYDGFHRTHGNEICHFVGIPLILVTTLGLLGGVSLGSNVSLGLIFWALATLWYLVLDWKLGLPFSFVTLGCLFLGTVIPVPILWLLFVLGWVFQGVGHAVYEKKSPAFAKNLEHLLIGPLWVFARLVKG